MLHQEFTISVDAQLQIVGVDCADRLEFNIAI
jgi:hypothetical protein